MSETSTMPLCGHCGRPAPFAVWWGGKPYHLECTQSPYKPPSQKEKADDLAADHDKYYQEWLAAQEKADE